MRFKQQKFIYRTIQEKKKVVTKYVSFVPSKSNSSFQSLIFTGFSSIFSLPIPVAGTYTLPKPGLVMHYLVDFTCIITLFHLGVRINKGERQDGIKKRITRDGIIATLNRNLWGRNLNKSK